MRNVPYAEGIEHVLWPVMVTLPMLYAQSEILAQFVSLDCANMNFRLPKYQA